MPLAGTFKRLGAATVAAALFMLTPAESRAESRAETGYVQTHLLRQLYTSGLARMAKGDPQGAADLFRLATEVAPELPQMHFSLGLAKLLADWQRREEALPSIDAALYADPANALYGTAKVLADPALSRLGADGALHLTPEGAERLRAAAAALGTERTAINGRYLAALLSEARASGDAQYPLRLAGFDRMIGAGGKIRLPGWQDSQPFGRLFAAAIPDSELQAYEPRLIARLQDGLYSLSPENLRRLQMRPRSLNAREQRSAATPLVTAELN